MTVIIGGIKAHEYSTSEEKLLWAPLYEAVLRILGSTGVIIPMGDTNHENAGRTTVTTVGEEAAVFTYSEAVSGFDIAPSVQEPARIPIISLNATDEEADTPDAAYWTRDDAGGANGFSIGFWANVTDTAAIRVLLGTWDATNASELREWILFVDASDILTMLLFDESANVQTKLVSDAAITMGSLRFFVMTYDGAGGSSAGDTIALYEDGVVLASTATNNGSYVGMEDLATLPTLGSNIVSGASAGDFFSGSMAGGPLGPFFTQTELTADAVLRLFQLGRAALNV